MNLRSKATQYPEENKIDASNDGFVSRRQKLYEMAKNTRNIYLPRISSFASNLGSRGFNSEPSMGASDIQNPLNDAEIKLYPSYTRAVKTGGYIVEIRGILEAPSLMTRKNRLILSVAKQIVRYSSTSGNEVAGNNYDDNALLENVDRIDSSGSDSFSFHSETSLSNINGNENSTHEGPATTSDLQRNVSSTDSLLRERLSNFMTRRLQGYELKIIIGSRDYVKDSKISEFTLKTDQNGCFETKTFVRYFPSLLEVYAVENRSVSCFEEPAILDSSTLGIISDIDDTVKKTGVVGDKRELLKNLLTGEVSSWLLPSIVNWYQALDKTNKTSFFYVSNSPWQLYSAISEYFSSVNLPKGSIQLKQYSGNILSSIMEPSSSRKKKALENILNDFETMDFVCIGDSGEYDFEAYVDLAAEFPGRIRDICIRYVRGSLSDLNDQSVLKNINQIIRLRANPSHAFINHKHSEASITDNSPDLIDLSTELEENSSTKRPAPVKPKKPDNLKLNHHLEVPPPLPRRKVTRICESRNSYDDANFVHKNRKFQAATDASDSFSSKPRASKIAEDVFVNASLVYHIQNECLMNNTDKRGSQWMLRVIDACYKLQGSDTKMSFFTDDDELFFKNFTKKVNNYVPDNQIVR